MLDWRKLSSVYVPDLSGAGLLSKGELFNIGDGLLRPNEWLAPHWHDTYELGYIRGGKGIKVLGNREYPLQTGQVYIINDLEPHMIYATEAPVSMFVVHFHPSLLDDSWIGQMRDEAHLPFLRDFSFDGPMIPLDDPVTEQVRGTLQTIRQEAQTRQNAWEIVTAGLILQGIGYLSRRLLERNEKALLHHQKRREAMKTIQPILELIEARYADPLSLDDMAQAAFLSRSHCCALFKIALDTTPVAYRNARRLAEARHLLHHTDLSVRAIAYDVGFSSVQEFNRLFLREMGLTPTQFRSQLYERLQNIRS